MKKNKIKILFVSHEFSIGGSTVSLISLIQGLKNCSDIEIQVLIPQKKEGLAQKEFCKRKISFKTMLYRRNYKRISERYGLKFRIFDILNTFSSLELCKHIKKETALLCQMTHNDISAIRFCYIGGNTTMIHLLFGYDCTSLGHSPFMIKVPSPEPLSIGNCTVYTAPWISAFVGGDITAGLLSCHLPSSGENALFLDLGTNGEMVLNHKGKLYTAATAAGPAFEGNGLSCGCPGISGAISHVVLRTLFPSLTTINNAHPIGICGSGAISLCAELLRKHYVTSDGVLTEKFKTDGIVLSKSPDGKSITFLPEDLRSIQLAIAAIAAGIDILLAESGVSKKESFTLYLGGGFGFHLSIEDCQCIGLFSDLCISEIKVMGNTCLQGLYQWAVYERTPAIQNDCVPLNLGEHPDFQKTYLHHMTFPDIR